MRVINFLSPIWEMGGVEKIFGETWGWRLRGNRKKIGDSSKIIPDLAPSYLIINDSSLNWRMVNDVPKLTHGPISLSTTLKINYLVIMTIFSVLLRRFKE